jgi:pimeloyl-ACP methyl ester carboxylesterase
MKMHCNSIKSVIRSKVNYTKSDTDFISNMYFIFNDTKDGSSAKLFSSYTDRKKSLIMAWVSPTDGAVSFSWLKLPKDWNPEQEYPMYVNLHGLWDVAADPIEYLSYPYNGNSTYQQAYEDAFLLSPWGRGNKWYEGISETDIWECIHKLQSIAKVDFTRMYLSGHSMGGYGAWKIALKSPGYWAAVGIHAGALYYTNCVNEDAAQTLKNVPVYFVVGNADGLNGINTTAYTLLRNAGNNETKFVTFEGGHDYFESNVYNMYLWMSNYVNEDFVEIKNTNYSKTYNLSCFPNPATNICKISYYNPYSTSVELKIIDVYGKVVKMFNCENETIGKHELNFDASTLKPSVYILSLKNGSLQSQTKMIVVK